VIGAGTDLTGRLRHAPGVQAVDYSVPVEAIRTDRGSADGEEAEGIDPASFARARRLGAVHGSLADLSGDTVAVSKELSGFEGYHLGDTMTVAFTDGTAGRLRVVAVVDAPPEVVPAMLLPKDLAARHGGGPAERWFVQPAAGVSAADLVAELDRLIGPDGDAMVADEWFAHTNADLRKDNQFGLLVMLGPAGLYAALTIANTLLMGTLQRRREYITTRLLGATAGQVRRTVLLEAALVAAVALSLGAVISATVGLLIRRAMLSGTADFGLSMPWLTLAGIGAGSLVIAILAALVPTTVMLRSTRPADAVGD
jgi:putative ABC transport system permease protein